MRYVFLIYGAEEELEAAGEDLQSQLGESVLDMSARLESSGHLRLWAIIT